jgi:hypothetical protein
VARCVPSPWHLDHRGAVLGTLHPGRLGLDIGGDGPEIERPPPPPALPSVIARASPPAAPAAARSGALARTHRGHDRLVVLIELDALDDRRFDTEQALPYFRELHAAVLPSWNPAVNSRKPRKGAACDRGWATQAPTDVSQEPEIPGLVALVSLREGRGPETESRARRFVAALNAELPSPARVGRVVCTTVQFKTDNGLLTRNLKLDRRAIYARFRDSLLGEVQG